MQVKVAQPHRGCVGLNIDTQGSRGGNPGLEAATASRLFGTFKNLSDRNVMLEKLEQIEKHYEELTTQLSAPEVMSDQTAYVKAAKQHRSLGEMVKK
jgi:hypothetical protein